MTNLVVALTATRLQRWFKAALSNILNNDSTSPTMMRLIKLQNYTVQLTIKSMSEERPTCYNSFCLIFCELILEMTSRMNRNWTNRS